ncbi:uncharacterized protein LOC123011509 isoform X1 [Tribolium madens]|uniref:uncharacterized protein LOC123011509 isoform X1 n=1 Tax=Tribolium madens TaxID=41895 RepID=UPI001CF72E65|nr:uncharacterized protein LOC123011509 isoform X1 [Tribolium madens]
MATPRFALKHGLFLFLAFVFIEGLDDYSNSFISPNSARDSHSKIEEIKSGARTSAPDIILVTSSTISSQPHKFKRSPDPILSRTDVDSFLTYKNVGESLDNNDVELSGRVLNINPSKTDQHHHRSEVEQTVLSGEGSGAPQGRSLKEPQEISPTATVPATTATALPKGRQANPDIQDIITGIVKLLNGNVNVQANTAPVMGGRPLRPLSTRINNRGPPRITDVPALPPDFDIPAPPLPPPPLGQKPPPVTSTRIPTPYPFDIPPHNTSPVKRPGLYRPVTIPPWNRRKPPSRRPIPPYKPMPPINSDAISLTTEKPIQDILTLDLGSQLQPTEEELNYDGYEENKSNQTFTNSNESSAQSNDKEITDFEKNKEKSTSKMNKHSSSTTKTTATSKSQTTTPISTSTSTSTTEDQISSTSTLIPILSSTSSSISSTSTATIEPTSVFSTTSTQTTSLALSTNVTNSTVSSIKSEVTPVLESSIQEVLQTLKEDLLTSTTLSSTPTEQLPKISSSKPEKSVTEASLQTNLASATDNKTSSQGFPYYPYRPRPGIVLDDTEYKPGGTHRQPILTRPPIGQLGDIFDITVSAIQGPGGSTSDHGKPYIISVDLDNVHNLGQGGDVITSPVGDEGFVSIDGKRTYLNLFGDGSVSLTSAAPVIKPSAPPNNQVTGTGYAVVDEKPKPNLGQVKPTQRRPIYGRPRPSQPPVRIDTCIVGDDSTCDGSQHEVCKTEAGVSACHCRPGHARRKHREPCRKIVSVLLSLRVDRLYERRIVWANELADKSSTSYQQLAYEAERALDSAMSMTPFSDEFLGAKVNSIYRGERSAGQPGVFVNLTLQLDENAETARSSVRGDIQKHLLGVIQRRSNNVGNSALWVDSPPGSISNLQDLDECSSPELHDCHALAKCINVFGGFRCECGDGYRDLWADNKHRAGRHCEQCSAQHCNNRGECKYQNGLEVCICSGNYYGNQCELDGEVLGVAIGASVAAVIIIGLTLVCLVMWSRRWSREQKAAVGSPVFGYMATASNTVKAPVVGAPPYQLTLEDRLRWAQIADVMAQANHYAVNFHTNDKSKTNIYLLQPEPVTGPTRPSSAMFGYPNLSGTLPHGSMHGTLPPVPLPRLNLQAQMANRAASVHGMRPLDNSSSSEEEDKADLLGRNFHVPRPKSRSNASIANQSGIYYDVDYDQNEIYKQSGGIPLSTYSMGRPPYYRN